MMYLALIKYHCLHDLALIHRYPLVHTPLLHTPVIRVPSWNDWMTPAVADDHSNLGNSPFNFSYINSQATDLMAVCERQSSHFVFFDFV